MGARPVGHQHPQCSGSRGCRSLAPGCSRELCRGARGLSKQQGVTAEAARTLLFTPRGLSRPSFPHASCLITPPVCAGRAGAGAVAAPVLPAPLPPPAPSALVLPGDQPKQLRQRAAAPVAVQRPRAVVSDGRAQPHGGCSAPAALGHGCRSPAAPPAASTEGALPGLAPGGTAGLGGAPRATVLCPRCACTWVRMSPSSSSGHVLVLRPLPQPRAPPDPAPLARPSPGCRPQARAGQGCKSRLAPAVGHWEPRLTLRSLWHPSRS